MKEQGISRSELAKRMGVQPSRVTSMMTGSNNFTIETLVRAGRAVGADIELHFVPMKKPAAQPARKAAKKAAGKTARKTRKLSRVAEPEKSCRAGISKGKLVCSLAEASLPT